MGVCFSDRVLKRYVLFDLFMATQTVEIGMTTNAQNEHLTGRCYCGRTTIKASKPPKTVAYCHCDDCRRSTGAPVAAYAAFDESDIVFAPGAGKEISIAKGVVRSFCPSCGSPLSGRYDYLPGTVYVPIGLIDNADDYPAELHAHSENRLSWLNLADGLPRHAGSARTQLNEK